MQQQFDEIAQRADVVGIARQGVTERGFGSRRVAGAVVDHAQGVAGIDEARVVQQGRAGVTVGLVQMAVGQGFCGAVVEVHRHDGRLVQRPGALAAQFDLRQEVNGQAFTFAPRKAGADGRWPQYQVDMPAGQVEAAAAAVEVVSLHGLEADGQAEVAGETGRHDHQRQAIARTRRKGLRCRPCAAAVVGQLQLALGVKRSDQPVPWVSLAGQWRQFFGGIGQHLVAECKNRIGVRCRALQAEEFVVQQGPRVWPGLLQGGASRQQRKQQQGAALQRCDTSVCGQRGLHAIHRLHRESFVEHRMAVPRKHPTPRRSSRLQRQLAVFSRRAAAGCASAVRSRAAWGWPTLQLHSAPGWHRRSRPADVQRGCGCLRQRAAISTR